MSNQAEKEGFSKGTKILLSILLIIGFVGGFLGSFIYDNYFKKVLPPIPVSVFNDFYEIGLVKADLETYGTVSSKVETIILDNIKDVHAKRHIPIGLLHCIFRVESEYRFNIDHPEVSVKVSKSIIKTHAIGLGGVMWCFWKDSLIANGIAEKETDLYLPDVNIQASGYILSSIIHQVLSDKVNASNVANEIIRRYYGAYNDLYIDKMKMIISDLWFKRMSKDIINNQSLRKNKNAE